MAQRWNDLLFAHWRVSPGALSEKLPQDIQADVFDGSAWLGVVPFWMDRVRVRVAGETTISIPGTRSFPELNLRTYVRSRRSGHRGVYFFSLDAGSLLAVLGARILFHLPYFPATMSCGTEMNEIRYRSQRWFPRARPAMVEVDYRATGPAALSTPGDLAHFLTERYCLYTTSPAGHLMVGEIHHLQWPLQPAEAEFRRNDLAADSGILLPAEQPLLHFAKELEVYIWGLQRESDHSKGSSRGSIGRP